MEQETIIKKRLAYLDEFQNSFRSFLNTWEKFKCELDNIHSFPAFLEKSAESFYKSPECKSIDAPGNQNESESEVLPQMIVTDFYDGETGKFSTSAHSSSFGRARRKPAGIPISMNQFFDAGDDGVPNHVTIVGPAGSGKSTVLRRYVRDQLQSFDGDNSIFIINGQNYHYLKKKRRRSLRERKRQILKSGRKRKNEADENSFTRKKSNKTFSGLEELHKESSDEMTLYEFLFPGYNLNEEVLVEGMNTMLESPHTMTFVIDSLDTLPFSLEGKHPPITPKDKATPATFMYNLMVGNLFPGCRILSSSREHAIAGYQGNLRADRIICLDGFTKKSIKKFVGTFLPENESEKFSEALERKYPDLWMLCSTPMYLVFTLLVYREKNDVDLLPTTMSGIIVEILSMFRSSDHATSSRKRLDIPAIISKLQLLSYNGIMAEKITFEQVDLDEVNLTAKTASALTTCIPRGRKKQVVEGNSKFFFCHFTIQEALCALHALQMSIEDFRTFVADLKKPALSVVRKFICGILLDEAQFDRAVTAGLLKNGDHIQAPEKRAFLLQYLVTELRRRMKKLEKLDLYSALQEAGEGASTIIQDNLSVIDMTSMDLSVSDMHVIGSMVDRRKTLKQVTLSDCSLTPQLMRALELALHSEDILIEKLDLSKNWEMKEDGAAILGNIVTKANVKSLTLDGCGFSHSQIQRFNVPLDNFKLKKLSMVEMESKPEVSDEMITAICSTLGQVTDSIDLHGFILSDDEEKKLKKELQNRHNKDRGFRLLIIHGEDGKERIEAERLEDVYEDVINDLPQLFFVFAHSGKGLSLSDVRVEEIRKSWPNDVRQQKRQLLVAWREKAGPEATCANLRDLVDNFMENRRQGK